MQGTGLRERAGFVPATPRPVCDDQENGRHQSAVPNRRAIFSGYITLLSADGLGPLLYMYLSDPDTFTRWTGPTNMAPLHYQAGDVCLLSSV